MWIARHVLAEIIHKWDTVPEFYAPGFVRVFECLTATDGPSGFPGLCGTVANTPGPPDVFKPSQYYPWTGGAQDPFSRFGPWSDFSFGLVEYPLAERWEPIPGNTDSSTGTRPHVWPRTVDPYRHHPDGRPFYGQDDPFRLPGIMEPGNVPRPNPYPRTHPRPANPSRDPWEQPQNPGYRTYPGAGSARGVPSTTTDFTPRPGNPLAVPRPSRYIPRLPRVRDKEKKFKLSIAGTVVGRLVNGVTETLDFTNAIWKAIPRKYRGRRKWKKPQDQVADIYNHFDKINWGAAWQNVLNNQIEDFLLGQVGNINRKASKRAAQWSGRAVGFQFGPAH